MEIWHRGRRAENTRSASGVINDDFGPEKPAKPLISNDHEKRPNHRQNSSKIVKTNPNTLIYNDF